MRYFLISFNLKNIASVGNLLIEEETFPSTSQINKVVQSYHSINEEVIILNIFEFKNKQDFQDFDQ